MASLVKLFVVLDRLVPISTESFKVWTLTCLKACMPCSIRAQPSAWSGAAARLAWHLAAGCS